MRCAPILRALLSLLWAASAVLSAQPAPTDSKPLYRYTRLGNPKDAITTPLPGFALMGGGKDLDEAFRWLCARAGGGDLVILRASGSDDYNPYIQNLCHLNSVATLVLPSRAAAGDPSAARIVSHAGALFISGGDQANYINFWTGTPVQSALNEAIRHGIPIGGTSAGLAVLGEWAYSAQGDKPDDPNLDSTTAMADPFGPRITLVHSFLDIPILNGIITDSHFAKRDRMGRLLAFLARLNRAHGSPSSAQVRGIGIEEGAAVLVEPDGHSHVIGNGAAYFISAGPAGGRVEPSQPLTCGPFTVQRVAPAHVFNLKSWQGDAVSYQLFIEAGRIRSTQPGGSAY